jgi:hypothetical protein
MSRNSASDCRKPCFGLSAAIPLPVTNNAVVLNERVASFDAADLAIEKFSENMRNEAIEVRLDFVGQNASQQCKVEPNGTKEPKD